MKTFIQKNFIDWKKLKDEVPKDEAKRVIKTDTSYGKAYFRVKKQKTLIEVQDDLNVSLKF